MAKPHHRIHIWRVRGQVRMPPGTILSFWIDNNRPEDGGGVTVLRNRNKNNHRPNRIAAAENVCSLKRQLMKGNPFSAPWWKPKLSSHWLLGKNRNNLSLNLEGDFYFRQSDANMNGIFSSFRRIRSADFQYDGRDKMKCFCWKHRVGGSTIKTFHTVVWIVQLRAFSRGGFGVHVLCSSSQNLLPGFIW